MKQVPGASGLFNLMRNLAGAIGLTLIDTVIYGRAPMLGRQIVSRLQAGDIETAKALGIPISLFSIRIGQPIDAATTAALAPLVEKLALVRAINEAAADRNPDDAGALYDAVRKAAGRAVTLSLSAARLRACIATAD